MGDTQQIVYEYNRFYYDRNGDMKFFTNRSRYTPKLSRPGPRPDLIDAELINRVRHKVQTGMPLSKVCHEEDITYYKGRKIMSL